MKVSKAAIVWLIAFVILATSVDGCANSPTSTITWISSFGGINRDEAYSVQETIDKGYIITGYTESHGDGNADVYVVKTDRSGNKQWSRTFGSPEYDEGYSVQQTSDGGYIIAGYTYSEENGEDIYLIKLSSSGSEQWSRTLGGPEDDRGYSVQQTTDGGYIVAGDTWSDKNETDVYLIKTNPNGEEEWSRTFGDLKSDFGKSVQQTSDAGYIIAGETYSYGAGESDVYLIKTDAKGNELWSRTFGGSSYDDGSYAEQTTDGGYIIVGVTKSYGIGVGNVYLIKTDSEGAEQWSHTFSGSGAAGGTSVHQTKDGGYILVGGTSTSIFSGNVYLIKTDPEGNEDWSRTFGGSKVSYGSSVQQTQDGGYIIAGCIYFSTTHLFDIYLIKTDAQGKVSTRE